VDVVESTVLPFVAPHGANTSLSKLFGATIPQAFIRTEDNQCTVSVFLAWYWCVEGRACAMRDECATILCSSSKQAPARSHRRLCLVGQWLGEELTMLQRK
jgi:hypothetical protein